MVRLIAAALLAVLLAACSGSVPSQHDGERPRDREARDREARDREAPDGEAPDGEAPDGEAPDGEAPDGGVPGDRYGPGSDLEPGPGGPRDGPVALDGGLERAVLHADGAVTGWGFLVCTPGEIMNVGFAIWNSKEEARAGGMVRTGQYREYYECTGERQEWAMRAEQILNGGISAATLTYSVKTAVGTGSRTNQDHRDYFNGTITVEEE